MWRRGRRRGARCQALAAQLGCEVIPVTARTGLGLRELVAAVDRVLRAEPSARWRWTPSPALRTHLDALAPICLRAGRDAKRRDAVALWALTRASTPTTSSTSRPSCAPRSPRLDRALDDEAVLGRWKFARRVSSRRSP